MARHRLLCSSAAWRSRMESICAVAIALVANGYLTEQVVEGVCANQSVLHDVERTTGVSAARVVCVARKETDWNGALRGSSGECGITQVLPGKHKCADLQVDTYAIRTTAALLGRNGYAGKKARRYCGSDTACVTRTALAVYNAGQSGVSSKRRKKWLRGQRYATAVLRCEAVLLGVSRLLYSRDKT